MSATIHPFASTTGNRAPSSGADRGAGAAAPVREDRPANSAVPRSAQSIGDMDAAVRTIVRMARLSALADGGNDAERVARQIARQGEILMLAGMQLLAGGGS